MTQSLIPADSTAVSTHYEKKKIGRYYTPPEVTKVLCEWAIRSSDDIIFEPSFGGCGFLESSYQTLLTRQCENPIGQLFGCDVDPDAFSNYLLPKYQQHDPFIESRFTKTDFLKLTVKDFEVDGFTAVVGNPPYISYQKMSEIQRESAVSLVKFQKIKLDQRANLWAYFVLHSLTFLKKGGRLAFVLPGSFLHTYYAEKIRKIVESCFSRSLVVQIGEKLFTAEGTEESTSILLAENLEPNANSEMQVDFASEVGNLQQIIDVWSRNDDVSTAAKSCSKASYNLLSNEILKNLAAVESHSPVVNLGEMADVSIGIVTGSNNFFIVDAKLIADKEIPAQFVKPIYSRFKMTNGLAFTEDDWHQKVQTGFRCLFLDTREFDECRDLKLKEYLNAFPELEKRTNITFSKRPIWHQPLYMRVPDAFFPYMHNSGPRIILNEAQTLSTNTIHRVYFKENNGQALTTTQRKLLAISILSTYSQFSAELEGRVYGSGALKIEPSEAKRIKIIFPKNIEDTLIEREFEEIDEILRIDNQQRDSEINLRIRDKVDNFLLQHLNQPELKSVFELLSSQIELTRKKRKTW